jgi:hypothetical protein
MEMSDTTGFSNRLEFEHVLINRRLTWLLTTQSILFAAYGLATRADKAAEVFLAVTPIAGIAVSGMIFIGILCGVFAKWYTWQDSEKKEFGVRTWITILALLPDLMLPVVFALAWIWIRQVQKTRVFWFVFVVAAFSAGLALLILYLKGQAAKKEKK